MAVARWWQLAIGVVVGAALCMTHARAAFPIAIVFGGLLAWSTMRSDGDDVMTVLAAGFVIGVLGVGLFFAAALAFGSLFG